MARPRKFDESDVVAAARDEFWSRGYVATSVDDLTSVTGLGKGSLYGAFGDKHGLFLRALDDYIGIALDGVRAQLRDPAYSAYDRLTRHGRKAPLLARATDQYRNVANRPRHELREPAFDPLDARVEQVQSRRGGAVVVSVSGGQPAIRNIHSRTDVS